jgi:fumarylacetoacetase-like protein
VERQEAWASGVTYLRSKAARMDESDFSATAYDKVYAAERPEIFFKSPPEKVVATGEPVGIGRDAIWNVLEPELALVMNSRGRKVGYTIGNDMSSRDIEGEHLLIFRRRKRITVPARWVPGSYWGCRRTQCAIGQSILIFGATGTPVSRAKPPSDKSNAVLKNWPDFFFAARTFRTAQCCSPPRASFRRTRSRWQRGTTLPSQSAALVL